MKDLFVDRLINITVIQGVARLDFARIDEIDPKEQQVKASPSYRLAMPLDALAGLAEQTNKAVKELMERSKSSGKGAAAEEKIQ